MQNKPISRNISIWFSISCMIILLCAACDPLQSIEIMNQTPSKASIKFQFNGEPSFWYEGFVTSDSLVIELDSLADTTFDFGIGTWKVVNAIDSLTVKVESIEITTINSTKTLQGNQEIQKFFRDRVKGNQSERIEINIE